MQWISFFFSYFVVVGPMLLTIFLYTALQAGSAEPPHAHPGDDMTVVVEVCVYVC